MKAIYKCRLCGKTYHNGSNTGYGIAEVCMVELHAGHCGTVPMAPAMTETHRCEDGSLGIADFQGWKKQDDNRAGDMWWD